MFSLLTFEAITMCIHFQCTNELDIVEQSFWIVPSATCLLANGIVLCWNAQPASFTHAHAALNVHHLGLDISLGASTICTRMTNPGFLQTHQEIH